MKYFPYYYLLILVINVAEPNDEICELKNGEIGVCTHIANCTAAQKSIKKREFSKICSFEGHYPIVCCPRQLRSRNISVKANGNTCLSHTGSMGICIPLEQCPKISLQATGQPTICGYERDSPIICCENKEDRYTELTGSIARRKCEEYKITTMPTTTTTTTPRPGEPTKPPVYCTIGGIDAYPLEFPHMAVLGYGSRDQVHWKCGGSLISENFVLTAAHCINTRLGKVAYVNLGVHQLNFLTHYSIQKFLVKNTYRHPDYSPIKDYHDIALIQLDRPANFQNGIKPACLHTPKKLPSDNFTATGWGATELHGDATDILQKVYLRYVSHADCAPYYQRIRRLQNGIMDDWQLCADGGGNRADTCQGDSGGPLQVKLEGDNLYTIVGVTSFGIKCAVVPAVYTRISNYIPWIENIVWPNE